MVYGSFTSFFKDKPVPAANDSVEVAPALEDTTLSVSPETRIVVIGDGEFFVDQKGGGDRDNLLFFQNMVDWLVFGGENQEVGPTATRCQGSGDDPTRLPRMGQRESSVK